MLAKGKIKNRRTMRLVGGELYYEADLNEVLGGVAKKFAKFVKKENIVGNDLVDAIAELYHSITVSKIVVAAKVSYENGNESVEDITIGNYIMQSKANMLKFERAFVESVAKEVGVDKSVVSSALSRV